MAPDPKTDSNEVDDGEWDDIKVQGNEVFFSADVDDDSVCYLFKILRQLETNLLYKMIENPGYKPEIRLFINSNGGDMFAGFSAHDQLKQLRVPVTTIAVGCCASAATFILLGGSKRMIGQRAHVLIHQLATDGFWGKFEEMKDEMKNCKKFMNMAKDLYEENCDIPEKKMKNLMKKDIYLSPEECVKWKIVDEILQPQKIIYM
jgi:ATP-dependent Clp endopeptidase proteolytic subunit ClpP